MKKWKKSLKQQSLEDSGLLIEGVTKTIKNKMKELRGRIIGVLLGAFGKCFLGNMLAGRGATVTSPGQTSYQSQRGFLIPPFPLANFKI